MIVVSVRTAARVFEAVVATTADLSVLCNILESSSSVITFWVFEHGIQRPQENYGFGGYTKWKMRK